MSDMAGPAALLVTFIGAAAGRLVDAVADPNGGPVPQYLTQLGVTGVCLIIAWLMLRRSDAREAKITDKETAAHVAQVQALQHELEVERRWREDAEEHRDTYLAQLLGKNAPPPKPKG